MKDFVCLGQGPFRASRNNRTRWKSRTNGNTHTALITQTLIWMFPFFCQIWFINKEIQMIKFINAIYTVIPTYIDWWK